MSDSSFSDSDSGFVGKRIRKPGLSKVVSNTNTAGKRNATRNSTPKASYIESDGTDDSDVVPLLDDSSDGSPKKRVPAKKPTAVSGTKRKAPPAKTATAKPSAAKRKRVTSSSSDESDEDDEDDDLFDSETSSASDSESDFSADSDSNTRRKSTKSAPKPKPGISKRASTSKTPKKAASASSSGRGATVKKAAPAASKAPKATKTPKKSDKNAEFTYVDLSLGDEPVTVKRGKVPGRQLSLANSKASGDNGVDCIASSALDTTFATNNTADDGNDTDEGATQAVTEGDVAMDGEVKDEGGKGGKAQRGKPATKLPSSLPFVLPKKFGGGNRTNAIIQMEEAGFDLSGDMGAIGRLSVLAGEGVILDIKGHQYAEAKAEAMYNEVIQLDHLANVLAAMSGKLEAGEIDPALLNFEDVDGDGEAQAILRARAADSDSDAPKLGKVDEDGDESDFDEDDGEPTALKSKGAKETKKTKDKVYGRTVKVGRKAKPKAAKKAAPKKTGSKAKK